MKLGRNNHRAGITGVAVAVALLVAACGGGGGGAPVTASAGSSTPATSVTGAVVKGPVNGATVCAYTLVAAGKGDKLACTTSKADGSYDLSVDHSGPVLVEATGGTYTDEATGTQNVPLAEPLRAVGVAGQGGSSLVPTPLTELAVRKALANGALTDESFKAAAAQVAAAFGLGAGVDIAKTLPSVSGMVDAYGSALIGVSKMLAKGATLTGILSNGDLSALQAGFQKATSSACNLPTAQQLVSAPAASVDFTVAGPLAAWRSLLPAAGGSAMGCSITANSAQQVKLSCPSSALSSLALYGSEKAPTPLTLPGTGVLLAGDGIAAGDVAAVAGSITFTDAAGAAIPPTATLVIDSNGTINLGNGLALGGGGTLGGATPVVTTDGPRLQLCTLAANGGVSTGTLTVTSPGGLGGNISVGGTGTISTGGGTVSTGGGTISTGGVSLGGGTLTVGGTGGITTTGTGGSGAGSITLTSGH